MTAYPGCMARPTADARATKTKEPGRLKQMVQVFQMTIREDSTALWIMIATFVVPILVGVGVGLIFSRDNWLSLVLWIVVGVMGGLALTMFALGRLAERAAYSRIEGQQGAVSAVIQNGLRGGWTGSEMPVAVSPKTRDAVYRVIGRGGVALIGEGPVSRTRRMLDEQKRAVARVLPNVPIHEFTIGPDEGSLRLHKLSGSLRRLPKTLRKPEVRAVANRLESLSKSSVLPIPKGIDPTRARAPRPR